MAHTNTDQFTYQSTAVSSRTFTFTQSFPAGVGIVGSLVTTSSGSQITMSSITDSKSNTWVASGSGSTVPPETFNASTVQVHIFHCHVGTSIVAGDTFTITLGATASRWAVTLEGFDDLVTSSLFDVKATNTGSSATMTSGTTGTTAQANELVFVAYGFGSTHNANIPSGWAGSSQVSTTGGSNDRAVQVMWKYVTATGAQSNTSTLDSSSVYAGAIATYKQATFAGTTFSPGAATTTVSTTATAWTLTLKADTGGTVIPPPTPGGHALIGVALTTQNGLPGETTTSMANYEADSLRPMDVFRTFNGSITEAWFGSTSGNKNQRLAVAAMGAGHVPVLSTHVSPYTWAQFASGGGDSTLAARAAEAISFGKPFFVAIEHEPENSIDNTAGSGYTMTDLVAAKRHFVNYMKTAGVTNATFMDIWTGAPDNHTYSGTTYTPSQLWSATYAGDAYMDWVGMDCYDRYPDTNTSGLHGLDSRFSNWVTGFYNWAKANTTAKIACCEFGIDEFHNGDNGAGKKAQYGKFLLLLQNECPDIAMICQWQGMLNYTDETWYIESSTLALQGWQTFCNDPWFAAQTPTPGGTNLTGTLNVTATATPAFSGGTTSKAGTLSVSASASPFFVGSGTGGGATSSSSLTWPGVTVSAQFAGVWTDITSKVALLPDTTLISMDAGRTFELDTVEATTVSFALDNRDGRFDPTNTSSPYWPNVVALCPIRIQTTWLGHTYSLFTGYVERWPQTWEQTGLLGVSSPVATDALALLAVQKLLAPWVGQAKASGADSIYPLTEAAGATTVTDLLGNGPAGTLVRKNGGRVTLGGDPPDTGLGNASFTPDGYIRITPPLVTQRPFSLEFIFNVDTSMSSGIAWLGYQGDRGSDIKFNGLSYRVYVTGNGAVGLTVDTPNGFEAAGQTPAFTYTLGDEAHAVFVFDTSNNISIYVDGVGQPANPTAGGTFTTGAAATDVTLLGNLTQNEANGMTGSISGFAVYDGVALTASQASDLYQAYLGFPGQRTDQRASTIVTQAGWTGGTSFDVGSGTMGSADFDGRTVLDLLQETALVEGTDIHVDGSGALVMRSRSSLQHPASVFTFGENAGEVHYEDIEFDYDPTYLYTQVVVSRPDGGTVTQTVPNSPYGLRTYELNLNVGSDSEALSAAQHYLALYQQPHLRVARLTFNPSALKDFTAAFTLQLGDAVTVNCRAPGATPISGTFMVQHISHDVASGVWRTTLSLSPVDTASYLVLNDATFGQLDQEVLGW